MTPQEASVTNLDARFGDSKCGNVPAMKNKWPNGLAKAMHARDDIGPTALAALVGTSKQNIQRWRDGERELPNDWAKKIAPHLGVSAADLLLLNEALPAEPSPALAEVLSLTAQLDPSEVAAALAALTARRAGGGRSKSTPARKPKPVATAKSGQRTHS